MVYLSFEELEAANAESERIKREEDERRRAAAIARDLELAYSAGEITPPPPSFAGSPAIASALPTPAPVPPWHGVEQAQPEGPNLLERLGGRLQSQYGFQGTETQRAL